MSHHINSWVSDPLHTPASDARASCSPICIAMLNSVIRGQTVYTSIMEICLKILILRVPLFKVTQGQLIGTKRGSIDNL